ncbi:hypothetical protein M9458_005544, partial [Cirrhinus mrigala]
NIWRLCWACAMTAWRGSCISACSLCWQPVPSVPCCVPSHVPGPSSPSGRGIMMISMRRTPLTRRDASPRITPAELKFTVSAATAAAWAARQVCNLRCRPHPAHQST